MFAKLKAEACSFADMALQFEDDGLGKPCNAFSASVRFTAEPANVGREWDGGIDVPEAGLCDAAITFCDRDN
jgi:hypothetical protein